MMVQRKEGMEEGGGKQKRREGKKKERKRKEKGGRNHHGNARKPKSLEAGLIEDYGHKYDCGHFIRIIILCVQCCGNTREEMTNSIWGI